MQGMQLAFIASESIPFSKTGGLADVVGTLPQELAKLGHDVTIIVPEYTAVRAGYHSQTTAAPVRVGAFEIPIGQRIARGEVWETSLPHGVRALLIRQSDYFGRPGLYQDVTGKDYPDNCERFTFLCRAAFEAIELANLRVDCLHCHDWQTGLIPAMLRHTYSQRPRFRNVGSVFTIHNIAYQGNFPSESLAVTGLPPSYFSVSGLEYYGNLSFLKGGIVFSDMVTTVSKTYAREIQGPEFGNGMQGILAERADRLVGIVNGIDYQSWDSGSDPELPAHYDIESWRVGKPVCKRRLRESVGLADHGDRPLLGMVSRLTDQKGLDLLDAIATDLMAEDIQLVVLGAGEPRYQSLMRRLASQYPDRFAVRLEFDEALARQIYAGADIFLMPSRFEPCGLSQLYSLRYGAVPVVRAVGGLADTVVDASPMAIANQSATGFQFIHYTPQALLTAIRRALATFAKPDLWAQIVVRGMSQDWSWEKSAREYLRVYERVMRLKR